MNGEIKKILTEFYEEDLERYKEGTKIPTILQLIKSDKLSKDQLIKLILIRCELAHFFEDQLRFIIDIIKKSELSAEDKKIALKPVEQNLNEEMGALPQYGRAHKDDREVFLEALGINYATWSSTLGSYNQPENIHPATQAILEQTKALIKFGPAAALLVLWYWEHRLSRGGEGEFFIFLKAFEKKFPKFKKKNYREGDILWWPFSHADHDTYHAQIAADGIELMNINTKFYDKKFIIWILETMDGYFDNYWYSIYSQNFIEHIQ